MTDDCNSHGEFACKFIPSCQWNDKLNKCIDDCPTHDKAMCEVTVGCTWKDDIDKCMSNNKADSCLGYNISVQGVCQPRVGFMAPRLPSHLVHPSHAYDLPTECNKFWDHNNIKGYDRCLLPYFGDNGYPPKWDECRSLGNCKSPTIISCGTKGLKCSDYCEGVDVYKTKEGNLDSKDYYPSGKPYCQSSCEEGVVHQFEPPHGPNPPNKDIPLSHNKLVGCLMSTKSLASPKSELDANCSQEYCMKRSKEACNSLPEKSLLEPPMTCRDVTPKDGAKCENYYQKVDGVSNACKTVQGMPSCVVGEKIENCCDWYENGYPDEYKEVGQCCYLQKITEDQYDTEQEIYGWDGEKIKKPSWPRPVLDPEPHRQFPKCWNAGVCDPFDVYSGDEKCDSTKLCDNNRMYEYCNPHQDYYDCPQMGGEPAFIQCFLGDGGCDDDGVWGACNPNEGPR
jgi:hypothetical protein